jgi:hypothetical protein
MPRSPVHGQSTVAVIGAGHVGADVVLGLPSIVGRGGVERTLVLPLDPDERRQLQDAAEVLTGAYSSLAEAAPAYGTLRRRNRGRTAAGSDLNDTSTPRRKL